MTNQEAIKILSKNTWANYLASQKDFNDAIQQAINALTAMEKIRDIIQEDIDCAKDDGDEGILIGLKMALGIVNRQIEVNNETYN